MILHKKFRFPSLALLLLLMPFLSLLLAPRTLSTAAGQLAGVDQSDLERGNTYCEIIFGGPDFGTVMINGTVGGACPDRPGYYDLTVEDIREVHGSVPMIKFNGIRQWMISNIISQVDDDENSMPPNYYQTYGHDIFPDGSGLLMFRAAFTRMESQKRYQETHVARYQTFVWDAGQSVYELVTPNCDAVYVMQSFYIGHPGDMGILNGESELPSLWETGRIDPPTGWIYRRRVPSHDIVISGVDGVTPVIQDDVKNSYSRMDDDGFDPSVLCPN